MGIISEIILFTSQVSPSCTPCINLIREYNVPAKIVRLDTPDARKKAKYNKKVSITVVPLLAVIFEDDDLKTYKGCENICKWLRIFNEQTKEKNSLEPSDDSFTPSESSISGTSAPSAPSVRVIDTASDDENTTEILGSIESFSEIPVATTDIKSSKMKSTLEMAKEMEAQFKKQYGGDNAMMRNEY